LGNRSKNVFEDRVNAEAPLAKIVEQGRRTKIRYAIPHQLHPARDREAGKNVTRLWKHAESYFDHLNSLGISIVQMRISLMVIARRSGPDTALAMASARPTSEDSYFIGSKLAQTTDLEIPHCGVAEGSNFDAVTA
jgi:hypothetical protein